MLLHLALLLLLADPAETKRLLQKGLTALEHGNLVEARETLEQASKADPQNGIVWSSLADVYFRLGDSAKATRAATSAEKLASDNPIVWHALALYYAKAGDLNHAASDEQKFAASAKADPQVSFDFVQALLRAEDFNRAADVANSVLARHPENAQLTLALGVARYGQRRFEDAVVNFLKTIRLDPSVEQPYLFLARILDEAGTHLAEITALYESWVAREPQNPRAYMALAKALRAADRRNERAEGLLRRSVALDPNNWEAHYELGVLLADKRQYPEAASELKYSIRLNSEQAMPHYHLARVYDRLGQPEHAKSEREIHQRLAASGH